MLSDSFTNACCLWSQGGAHLDAPLSVGILHYRNERELLLYLRSLRHVRAGRLTVVLGIRDGAWASPAEIPPNVRIFYTADQDAVNPREFSGWYDADPYRAVRSALMGLHSNETLLLLLPADWSGPKAEDLVARGRRWQYGRRVPENEVSRSVDDYA